MVMFMWDPTDFVIAVDPGLVTGYSTWTSDTGFQPTLSGQLGWVEFQDWLEDTAQVIATQGQSLWVQWEKFTISARTIRTAVQYESLYVNGMIQHLCHRYGFGEGSSTPEQVMRIFSNDVLQRLGWYLPGLGHQHDSARHLGHVLLNRRIITSKDMSRGEPRGPQRVKKIK